MASNKPVDVGWLKSFCVIASLMLCANLRKIVVFFKPSAYLGLNAFFDLRRFVSSFRSFHVSCSNDHRSFKHADSGSSHAVIIAQLRQINQAQKPI